MFDNIEDIYNYIGETMVRALPECWGEAWIELVMYEVDRHIQTVQGYRNQGEIDYFDVDVIDGEIVDTNLAKAFFELYKIMQKNDNDVPWNKARYLLHKDGGFDVEFKLDKDFEYYNGLKYDSKEFNDLDIDIIDEILTWQGLPEDAERYWC